MAGDPGAAVTLRPALKWAGGKRWLVPALRLLYAAHRPHRLVEPFCGALSVALGLDPARALLNDINRHAVNFHRQVQRGLSVRIALRNARETYDAHRESFNALIEAGRDQGSRAAQYFYYLNRTGFNGLCRFNSSGLFNVPFGRHASVRYRRDFDEYRQPLGRWRFSSSDFAALDLCAGDFVYADPPYDTEFHHYSAGGFGWAEQVRLAEWLSTHDGPVVLSNQATARIVELYRDLGFEVFFLAAPRAISCNGDRRAAREVLALRNVGLDATGLAQLRVAQNLRRT